jgi:hypothetical protein
VRLHHADRAIRLVDAEDQPPRRRQVEADDDVEDRPHSGEEGEYAKGTAAKHVLSAL